MSAREIRVIIKKGFFWLIFFCIFVSLKTESFVRPSTKHQVLTPKHPSSNLVLQMTADDTPQLRTMVTYRMVFGSICEHASSAFILRLFEQMRAASTLGDTDGEQ